MSIAEPLQHSSDMVGALLRLTTGPGGGKLVLLGEYRRGLPYWAGLRHGAVDTLLEAVLRCLLAAPYERIVAFTGAAQQGLPAWLLGHGLSLGDEAVAWVVRGERKRQAAAAERGERLPFELDLADLGPVAERFDRLLWRSERKSYWDRLEELIRLRDREIAQARETQRRTALVVDLAFVLPAPHEATAFRRQDHVAVERRTARAIEKGFPVPAGPALAPADFIFLAEDGLANELLDENGRLLSLALSVFFGQDWTHLSQMVERTVPPLYLGPGCASAPAVRMASPFRARSLELDGAGEEASVYELIRCARISHKPSVPAPPRYSDRIDLEFWADLDLEPLRRAFEEEIIGQEEAKRGILELLGSYRDRCRDLLLSNPAAVKTPQDDNFRLPVFGLFGAAGMGKTTFCKIMARHLFGKEDFTLIMDLSEKLLSTLTLGVAPPYVGWDVESPLIRFARENRGLGLICFDEFVRIQLVNNQKLADALSSLLELLQDRRFMPASPRFMPPGRRFQMANTIFVFSGNVSPADERPLPGFQNVDDLGPALSRRIFEGGAPYYFTPLLEEDYHQALRFSLRRGARGWAKDFMSGAGSLALVDQATIEDDLLAALVERFTQRVAASGGQPSIALISGMVGNLPYKRSFDAMAARGDDRLVLGLELLDREARS